ncbi:hypothetical protein JK203_14565 [Gluconobacter cerinus]|uniref:hypothetical protein n=1 Tax=Gluconobacter cerinus TaxID=38307 RepID=UPI001B8B44B3|nr:hypothetical protein [Gluconobacter cerinus]MBS1042057.1 hypothetical protein [Gluconobacter cerinus]MBS1048649.1 hypothetical protein [Gluconobacter cerinus]
MTIWQDTRSAQALRFLQSRGLMQPSTNAPTGESVNYTALKNLIKQIEKNEVSVATKGTDAVTPEQEARIRTLYRDMLAERTMRDAGGSVGSKTFKAWIDAAPKGNSEEGTWTLFLAPQVVLPGCMKEEPVLEQFLAPYSTVLIILPITPSLIVGSPKWSRQIRRLSITC